MMTAERRARTERKIKQRIAQAQTEGFAIDQPHRWAKRASLGCCQVDCWICNNPIHDRPRQRDWSSE